MVLWAPASVFLLHSVLDSFRACLHALLQTSAVVVPDGVSECEVDLCAVSALFHVAVYNHCACVVLAWLCVSDPRYVPQPGRQ